MATKYLVIQGTANSSEEAITLCGEALHKAGVVGEDFAAACVEREKNFPTGLPTEIPTAIVQVLQRMMEFLNNKEVLLKCKELSNEETVAYLTEQLG